MLNINFLKRQHHLQKYKIKFSLRTIGIFNNIIKVALIKTTVICLVHKNVNKQVCSNYRETALLSVAYRIFSNCTLLWLKIKLEIIIDDYQIGFKP